MAVTRFQDLIAWQKARLLTGDVYRCTANGDLARDWGLRDQMRRSSVSVMANLAEGFERNKPGQFAYFIDIAKGSCAELQSHLVVALDVGYLDPETYENLDAKAQEVSRIIGGLQRRHAANSGVTPRTAPRDSGLGTRDS